MRRWVAVLLAAALAAGCGGNPYLDQSLDAAELEGKDKAWFEKHWGTPSGKAQGFFGTEKWTYFRIAGGQSSLPFIGYKPNECQITLKFDRQDKLTSYSYSGC
jgi:hypothetical protein